MSAEAAGIWVRVSTGQQDEQSQVPDVERHCTTRGYEITRRYEVHGKSASKGEHQQDLDAMLADMRNGIISVLVIWHSDRVERRPGKALLDLLAEVAAAGGRVESVKEPMLGQLDFGSQVTTFIAGLVNAEKSRHISEQVGIAFDRIRINGGLIGKYPWGYTATGPKYDKHLVPTPEGRTYAPQIFQEISDGRSLGEVARWLTEETGRDWWPRTVGTIVRNPLFRGVHYDTTGKTAFRVEAIVPADLWKRANDTLNGNRNRKSGGRPTAAPSLLSGLLRCAHCENSPLYRIRPRDGVYRYRCYGRGSQRKGCGCLLLLDVVDSLMNEIMSGSQRPVTERRLVRAGQDYAAQAEEIRYELQHLSMQGLEWDAEDKERARLRGLLRDLEGRDAEPDVWADVPTGRTYGDEWKSKDLAERRAWLKTAPFTVYAGRMTQAIDTLDSLCIWDADADVMLTLD